MAVSPTALQSFGANASSSTYLRHLVLKRGLLRFAVLALDLLSSQRGAHVVQHGEDITQVLAAHTYFGGVGGGAGQHETRGETRNAPSLSPSLYLSLSTTTRRWGRRGRAYLRLICSRASSRYVPGGPPPPSRASRRPPRTARSCRLASSIASTERPLGSLTLRHDGVAVRSRFPRKQLGIVEEDRRRERRKWLAGEQDMAPAKGKGKKRVRDQAAVEVVDLDDDDDGLDSVKEGSGELNREREAKEYAMHIKGICEEANAAIAAARGADLVSEEVRALSLQTLARKSPAPGLRLHPSRLEHRLTLALSCSCSSPPGRCALRRSSRSSWGTSCGTSCSTSVSRTANRSQGKRSRLW